MDLQQVIDDIRSAFANTQRPSAESISDTSPYRDTELEQIQRDFADRDWQTLEVSFLSRRADDMFRMAAAAFVYFLPAYLIAAVEHPEASDLVLDAVVLSLTTPEAEDEVATKWFEERAVLLTRDQRQAAKQALEYLAAEAGEFFTRDEPAVALERWALD